jgi:hypothetical protein
MALSLLPYISDSVEALCPATAQGVQPIDRLVAYIPAPYYLPDQMSTSLPWHHLLWRLSPYGSSAGRIKWHTVQDRPGLGVRRHSDGYSGMHNTTAATLVHCIITMTRPQGRHCRGPVALNSANYRCGHGGAPNWPKPSAKCCQSVTLVRPGHHCSSGQQSTVRSVPAARPQDKRMFKVCLRPHMYAAGNVFSCRI